MNGQELAFAGVVRQAELIRSGEVSSRELTELYLERIERIDPQLNAFRTVLRERALADAEQADARRAAGDGQRPLLGVPIAVKDFGGPRRARSRPGAPRPTARRPRATESWCAGCAPPAP